MIARLGVVAVFAMNTLSFAVYGLFLVAWRPTEDAAAALSERFTSALRAGASYVRYSPVVRRLLLRLALFLVPGSALWALLPLVATQRRGEEPTGYEVLLGALGIGAVAGAFLLPQLWAWLSNNALLFAASFVYAAALVAVVIAGNLVIAVVVLLPAGVA